MPNIKINKKIKSRQYQTDFRNDIAFCVLPREVAHLIQHIFNENSVPRGGVVDENVGDSSHEFSVLDDRRATQECGQERTTKCVIIFIFSAALCISSFVGNLSGSVFTISNALYFDPA